MHRPTRRVWTHFSRLPENMQELARKNFSLAQRISTTSFTSCKKVGRFRSVRVGLAHRALAVEDGDDFIRVWIGTHDEHQRMIK